MVIIILPTYALREVTRSCPCVPVNAVEVRLVFAILAAAAAVPLVGADGPLLDRLPGGVGGDGDDGGLGVSRAQRNQ